MIGFDCIGNIQKRRFTTPKNGQKNKKKQLWESVYNLILLAKIRNTVKKIDKYTIIKKL